MKACAYMRVVLHHQQVFHAPICCKAFIADDEASNVFMLQKRDSVDGALINKVLTVGVCKHFYSNRTFVKRALIDRTIAPSTNQLQEKLFKCE